MNIMLLIIGGCLPLVWGITHFFPTRSVVKNFGAISTDNKHIITMEWIIEGVALTFIGLLVLLITIIDHTAQVSRSVYWLVIGILNVLSIVSLLTGFKINFLPYKLCPVIFTTASLLIFLGVIL